MRNETVKIKVNIPSGDQKLGALVYALAYGMPNELYNRTLGRDGYMEFNLPTSETAETFISEVRKYVGGCVTANNEVMIK
jgi:hypothetical protein